MTLVSFAHFSTFAPGIAPQVALALDPTELRLALAAIVVLAILALAGRARRARTPNPPRARSGRTPRRRGRVEACEATR